MRRTKTNNGITLIALIITIVVLLILAVVAINSITNEGIVAHTTNSTNNYNQAVANESQVLKNYVNFLDNNSGHKGYKVNIYVSTYSYGKVEFSIDNGITWKDAKDVVIPETGKSYYSGVLCENATQIWFKITPKDTEYADNGMVYNYYIREYSFASQNYTNLNLKDTGNVILVEDVELRVEFSMGSYNSSGWI